MQRNQGKLSLDHEVEFQKCNVPIHISLYFASTYRVYYDPRLDNFFPYGGDPDYWAKVVLFVVRKLKLVLADFTQPP